MRISRENAHFACILPAALLLSACSAYSPPQMSVQQVQSLPSRLEALHRGMTDREILASLDSNLWQYATIGGGPSKRFTFTYELRPGFKLFVTSMALPPDPHIIEVSLLTPERSYRKILDPAAVTTDQNIWGNP